MAKKISSLKQRKTTIAWEFDLIKTNARHRSYGMARCSDCGYLQSDSRNICQKCGNKLICVAEKTDN